jgi:hypothetical protein
MMPKVHGPDECFGVWLNSDGRIMLFDPPDGLHIEDEALREAICVGFGTPRTVFTLSHVDTKMSQGHLYLLMLVRRLFGVFRYPGYEDRLLGNRGIVTRAQAFYEQLTLETLDASCAELKRVYTYTQTYLAQRFPTGRIRLARAIRQPQASEIGALVRTAKLSGEATITLQMDTLNSFTSELGAYSSHDSAYLVTESIPLEDVLYCSHTVKGTEPGEFLVLNRSPLGLVTWAADEFRFGKNFVLDSAYQSHYGTRGYPYFVWQDVPDDFIRMRLDGVEPPLVRWARDWCARRGRWHAGWLNRSDR